MKVFIHTYTGTIGTKLCDPLAFYANRGTLDALIRQYGSAENLATAELANMSEINTGTYVLVRDGKPVATAKGWPRHND